MAKENKYLLWGIGLPIAALVLILLWFDNIPPIPRAILIFALVIPSPILIYRAQREVFGPEQPNKDSTLLEPSSLNNSSGVVDTEFNKTLRTVAWIMRVISLPLIYFGWQMVRNTDKLMHYVIGGLMLLVGVVMGGASIGFMKVANGK